MKPHPIPELLAPAGSREALRAAVTAGADAVYLGGKKFGARRFAANFTDDEMRDAIRYCHLRGVRVYVTVNTLMHDRELPGAISYLVELYAMGVDAVLLQDKGLAKLAREVLPGLTLQAATQMTVHNTAGVREAAELGFSRVVLARELALPEIERIAAETRDLGIGLEIFAHGALCYSYSGQCLLSSCIGGRSGNRGSCAQPCRKPYELVSALPGPGGRPERFTRVPVRERYLLSPKDLCTVPVLERIAASPVASLKIEGRMRTPEYVAVVVSLYRKILDRIREGTGNPDPEDQFFLEMAFSRGFTRGYLSSSPARDVMGRDLPGNRGVLAGTVRSCDRKTGTLGILPREHLPLRKGDGFVIRTGATENDETGFVLTRDPVYDRGLLLAPATTDVPKGAKVYLTRSAAFDEYAA
ncbi:MAG: peptidase U32 family protein, partial [Methanoregulaceae archaeon]